MITNARLGKEIVVTLANKIGLLADMTKLIADHGVNIETLAGYADKDGSAKIMMVTEDNQRVGDALKKAGYKSLIEREVVIVDLENKVGALKQVGAKLAAEGIDIKHVYGTSCAAGCPAKLVLSTNDNEKALLAFKK
jgi:hypothetical protein